MARRKVLLPNWNVSNEMAVNKEGLEATFEGLIQGEVVINTKSGYTSMVTFDENDLPVIFESSEMINRRFKDFLDATHTHDNKDILDNITAEDINIWNNTIYSAKTYIDQQIDLIVSGASEAFDTLKEVEEWVSGHTGDAADIIEDINDLKVSAHTHDNKKILDGIAQKNIDLWDNTLYSAKTYTNEVANTVSAITAENINRIDKAISFVSGAVDTVSAITTENINRIDKTIEENELVTSAALNVLRKSSGFDENGNSILPDDLTTSIINLQNDLETIELTPGPPAVITAVTATVGPTTGRPSVTVTSGKTENNYSIKFAFNGLKGETGSNGSDASISLSQGTAQYYILGVADKTMSAVTSAHISTKDVYIQNGEIFAASDETLKNFGDDIKVDFEKLAKIPKVYYTWKTDADNKQQIGTSAQKLREVYPELVSENEDGKLSVAYKKISIIALAAVDKLYIENKELKERLRKIEEKLGL